MIKDTIILKTVQKWATKFILADYSSDYKTHFTPLKYSAFNLLHMLDFYDIMFLVKSLQQPSPHFNIYNHISFSFLTPDHHLLTN